MPMPGVCRWCHCTYEEPCPGSCGWANRSQTLCTACVDVDREWKHLTVAQRPNMHRAFFRGFMAGSDDERGVGDGERNPYRAGGQTAPYWDHGYRAGQKQAR
jgi:hypothetical protein